MSRWANPDRKQKSTLGRTGRRATEILYQFRKFAPFHRLPVKRIAERICLPGRVQYNTITVCVVPFRCWNVLCFPAFSLFNASFFTNEWTNLATVQFSAVEGACKRGMIEHENAAAQNTVCQSSPISCAVLYTLVDFYVKYSGL